MCRAIGRLDQTLDKLRIAPINITRNSRGNLLRFHCERAVGSKRRHFAVGEQSHRLGVRLAAANRPLARSLATHTQINADSPPPWP